jgi:hypothetical protein
LRAITIIAARDAALAKKQGVRRWLPLVTHAVSTKLGVGWGLGGSLVTHAVSTKLGVGWGLGASRFFGDTLIYLEEAVLVERLG